MTFDSHALSMLKALRIAILFFALNSLFFYFIDLTRNQTARFEKHTMTSKTQPQPGSAASWLQARFTSLYESSPPNSEVETDFKVLFYSAFSEDATILRNHQNMKVEEFLNGLMGSGRGVGIIGSRVEWKGIMEVPVDGETNVCDSMSELIAEANASFRLRLLLGSSSLRAHQRFGLGRDLCRG